MAEKFISERNLKFLLCEMFNVDSLLAFPRDAAPHGHLRCCELFRFHLPRAHHRGGPSLLQDELLHEGEPSPVPSLISP